MSDFLNRLLLRYSSNDSMPELNDLVFNEDNISETAEVTKAKNSDLYRLKLLNILNSNITKDGRYDSLNLNHYYSLTTSLKKADDSYGKYTGKIGITSSRTSFSPSFNFNKLITDTNITLNPNTAYRNNITVKNLNNIYETTHDNKKVIKYKATSILKHHKKIIKFAKNKYIIKNNNKNFENLSSIQKYKLKKEADNNYVNISIITKLKKYYDYLNYTFEYNKPNQLTFLTKESNQFTTSENNKYKKIKKQHKIIANKFQKTIKTNFNGNAKSLEMQKDIKVSIDQIDVNILDDGAQIKQEIQSSTKQINNMSIHEYLHRNKEKL